MQRELDEAAAGGFRLLPATMISKTEIIGNRRNDDVVNVHQHIAAQVVPTGSGIDDDDTVFDRGQQLAKEGVAVARLAELGGGLHQ